MDFVALHHGIKNRLRHRIRAIQKCMQCIHVVNCDFEHDFALVWGHCANGFAQVSNLPSLGNSFIRFHEAHEFWELSFFEVSNNENVSQGVKRLELE